LPVQTLRFKPAGHVCRAASGETGSEVLAELSQESFLHDDQAQISADIKI